MSQTFFFLETLIVFMNAWLKGLKVHFKVRQFVKVSYFHSICKTG